MKHYLVTQWNCNLFDLGWLQRRQKLFEKFTLPSVEGQLNKNFEWLLISDSRTPDKFKNVLDRYPATVVYHDFEHYEWKVPDLGRLAPVMQFAVKLESIGDIVAGAIGQQDTDYIITSRLDNDDILAVEHMDKIQQHAEILWNSRDVDKFWLSLVRGLRWCEDKVYPFNSLANSFLSFVEDPNNLQTCYMCCHTLAKTSDYPIKGIRQGQPTWAEVIHGENVLNRLKRFRGEYPAWKEYGRFSFNG